MFKKIIISLSLILGFAGLVRSEELLENIVVSEGFDVEIYVDSIPYPDELCFDSQGNLYVSYDEINGQIHKVFFDGTLSSVGPTVEDPDSVAVNSSDEVFIGSEYDGLYKLLTDGSFTKFASKNMYNITSVVNDSFEVFGQVNTLFVSSRISNNGNIVKVTPNAESQVFMNTEKFVMGLAFDDVEYIYFYYSDSGSIYRADANANASLFVELPSDAKSITFNKIDRFLYIGGENDVYKVSLDGDISIFANNIHPKGLTFDSNGALYISDQSVSPGRILKISSVQANLLLNAGFESGLTDWNASGNAAIRDGNPDPYEGEAYLYGDSTSYFDVWQDIDLLSYYSKSQLDGGATVNFGGWQSGWNNQSDYGDIIITFFSEDGREIASFNTGEFYSNHTWTERSLEIDLPTGTIFIRYQFVGTRVDGSNNDAYLDAAFVNVTLWDDTEAVRDQCVVKGSIFDAMTGNMIPEATLGFSSSGFNKEYQTDIAGAFSITDIPAGTYQVQISADGYQPETYEELKLTIGVPQTLTLSLEQNAPKITNPWADKLIIINNKEVPTTFHADITDPDGIADIQSVSLNLSDINSGLGDINMSLVDADTGSYEAVITIPADTAARLYSVPVTAIDNSGYRDIETIEFEVTKKITATISPTQTMKDAFDNQIDMQSLEISIQFNETVQQRQGANILGADEDCYVEVKVYKPDGEFYETYQVYGYLDIVIDSAMEGQWTYETINYCAESIDVEIETRGSNTGILNGTVKDSINHLGMENALVDWALGGNATTDSQGFFSIVAVAGTCVLVTSSENYQTRLRGDVSLSSGKTTTLRIELVPENFVSLPVPESQSMEKILSPAGGPDYLNQPFAAYVEDGNLVISTCFAPYQEPVNIYLGMTLDNPDFSSFFFMFNPDDQLDFFTDTLFPWREMTSDWNEIELFSVPVILLPKADYTFCFLLTDDPDTLSSFDFKFFTIRVE